MYAFKREKRKQRYSSNQSIWMTLDGDFAKRNCTLLDVSRDGARIHISDPGAVEQTFNLAMEKDVKKLTRCRLVWRKGSIIGVQFVGRA